MEAINAGQEGKMWLILPKNKGSWTVWFLKNCLAHPVHRSNYYIRRFETGLMGKQFKRGNQTEKAIDQQLDWFSWPVQFGFQNIMINTNYIQSHTNIDINSFGCCSKIVIYKNPMFLFKSIFFRFLKSGKWEMNHEIR